jgi:hypothetical protein
VVSWRWKYTEEFTADDVESAESTKESRSGVSGFFANSVSDCVVFLGTVLAE